MTSHSAPFLSGKSPEVMMRSFVSSVSVSCVFVRKRQRLSTKMVYRLSVKPVINRLTSYAIFHALFIFLLLSIIMCYK